MGDLGLAATSFHFCSSLAVLFCFLCLFFKDFIYLFLERGEGREKDREGNISVWLPLTCPLLGTWPTAQACALTGNRTGDPVVHRLALNPLSHTSQGSVLNTIHQLEDPHSSERWLIQGLGSENVPSEPTPFYDATTC